MRTKCTSRFGFEIWRRSFLDNSWIFPPLKMRVNFFLLLSFVSLQLSEKALYSLCFSLFIWRKIFQKFFLFWNILLKLFKLNPLYLILYNFICVQVLLSNLVIDFLLDDTVFSQRKGRLKRVLKEQKALGHWVC